MLDMLKAFRPIASDFLSTILFIVAIEITHNVILATVIGIATGLAQFVWMRSRGQKLELMQWASLALVLVLGTATIVTRDARFVMIKPSIASVAVACVMLQRGWQDRYIPQIAKDNLPSGLLIAWGYAWSVLYFTLAALNLFFALVEGRAAWEVYTAFVPTLAPLAFFLLQYGSMRWITIRNIREKVSTGMAPVAAE